MLILRREVCIYAFLKIDIICLRHYAFPRERNLITIRANKATVFFVLIVSNKMDFLISMGALTLFNAK